MRKLSNVLCVPCTTGVLAATLVGLAAYFHFLYLSSRGAVASVLTIGLLLLGSGIAVAGACAIIPDHYRRAWGGGRGLARAGCALLIGALIGLVLPFHVHPVDPTSLSITALGTHNASAQSSEVWVSVEADGHELPPRFFINDGKWSFNGTTAVSAAPEQPATLAWSGRVRTLRLRFVTHAWSGMVRVTHDGVSRDIDLYRPQGKEGQLTIDIVGGGGNTTDALRMPHRGALQWLAFGIDAWLAGGLLVILFDLARGRLRRLDEPVPADPALRGVNASDYLLFSVPQFLGYLTYLVLFFPGVMTSDSLDQWTQVQTGLWKDWHPPVYGFVMEAARALWNSPAAVALIQVVAMAGATGVLITMARAAAGAPRWAALLGALFCAGFPLVGLDVVTLWKDILYSAAVVFLIGFAIGVVCLRLPLLRRPAWLLASFLAVVVCLAFRYNGLPFVLLVLGLIMLAVPPDRWRALFLVGCAMVTVHVINGPVLDALGTTRFHVSFTIAVHHIAAHQAAGEALPNESDRALIRHIWSGEGPMPYNCAYGGTTIFDPRFDLTAAASSYRELLDLSVRLARAHPAVELKHLYCVSSLVWRMSRTGNEPIEVGGLGIRMQGETLRWIDDNELGLKEEPTLGHLGDRIRKRIYRELGNERMRRPAFFLYLLLFASSVAIARQRQWALGTCVALTALAQSASILFFNVAQDPRYQLSVVITALALAPALILAARVRRPENPFGTSGRPTGAG